mmetsp:Transcript_23510/g.72323  ORF Transcript_23510/g.72323 Transcript_23510/m.72323 type:complete len:200 (+) Transcript_23510:636-1235(+)
MRRLLWRTPKKPVLSGRSRPMRPRSRPRVSARLCRRASRRSGTTPRRSSASSTVSSSDILTVAPTSSTSPTSSPPCATKPRTVSQPSNADTSKRASSRMTRSDPSSFFLLPRGSRRKEGSLVVSSLVFVAGVCTTSGRTSHAACWRTSAGNLQASSTMRRSTLVDRRRRQLVRCGVRAWFGRRRALLALEEYGADATLA